MSNLYRGSFKDASYQVSLHLVKRFQRRSFFQKLTNQKRELPVAAMFVNVSGRNEQSLQRNCHRCIPPSFGSFGHAVSEEKIKTNRPIRNKNCLWLPCLLMDRDKMSNLQRGPDIDASYQVSLHLAEGFQRRRLKCEKLTDDRRHTTDDGRRTTDDGRQMMAKGHIAFGKVSYKCVLRRESANTNFIVFGLTRPGLERMHNV